MNWLTPGKLIVAALLLSATVACSHVQALPSQAPESFAGIWQDVAEPGFFLEFQGSQILIASRGRIRQASTVLASIDDGLLVCEDGHESRMPLRRIGELIELSHVKDGKVRRLARIDSRPAALTLSLSLPEPVPLPEEEVLAIQREMRLRFESEQALFRQRPARNAQSFPWLEGSSESAFSESGPPGLDFSIVDQWGASAEYMRDLVQRIGWVDAKRFGYPASSTAFFLVQHSWDLALMLSILPRIKEDVAAGLMDGSAYALMFDRVQLSLGRPQSFGSQIARNADGDAYVLPLEDPQGVDVRRKQFGLQPLKDYVALFGASDVKLSTECSPLTTR